MVIIKLFRVTCLFIFLFLTACNTQTQNNQGKGNVEVCSDPIKVAKDFYAANDIGDLATGLKLLTDDVVLVSWAEGANGHHMTSNLAVGKDQVTGHLAEPGLRRIATGSGRPNFQMENWQVTGNIVRFELTPDRMRKDRRPFNPYSVEMILNGCQIEIIKVVERVTWL